MKLLALELSGFKSFARTTRLEFGHGLPAGRQAVPAGRQGLTAIIGPNGSGKSNLAEAVRWVLGEQSLKALRSQGREDILFAGTAQMKRAGRAYVRLMFDNADSRFPLEASEVTVTRGVASDGESEYLLNGEDVRLLDLSRMLAEAGIGTKTYTVISQGMVDRYLTASSAERKLFFDEACGVKPLHIRLVQTQKKLLRVQEHTTELRMVLQELTPRLALLSREIRKYEQKQRLEKEYDEKQASFLHQAWWQRRQATQGLHNQMEQLVRQAAQARARRAEITARLVPAAAAQPAAAPATGWEKRARKILGECARLIEALLGQHSVSQSQLTGLKHEIEQLQLPLSPHPQPQEDSRQALTQAQEEEIAAERSLTAARLELEHAETALSLLRQEIVRERGSAFLYLVETTAPQPSEKVQEWEIRALAEALARLGDIDPLTLREYQETREREAALAQQLSDITETAANIEQALLHLDRTIRERFSHQFGLIQQAFGVYFSRLFEGGRGELRLTEQGVEIIASPVGKRPRHVGLLSGGERTLTSLALLLSIIEVQAPPFVVLDEVDAALDEANSARFAVLLQEKSRMTQCIVITHNRETMARADLLYGVTMQRAGISTIYSVNIENFHS